MKTLEQLLIFILDLVQNYLRSKVATTSTDTTSAEIAIDAAPTVTAGITLTDDLVKAASTIFNTYQSPTMQLSAIQGERLAKAKAILDMVRKSDTTKTQSQLGSLGIVLLLCVSLALGGCSGMTVKPASYSASPTIDSSTPRGFSNVNSSFLGYHDAESYLTIDGSKETTGKPITGLVFGVLTVNGPAKYNAAMVQYAAQLKTYDGVQSVPANAGVTPFVDEYGNHLFAIDQQHLQYFLDAAAIASNPQLYPAK